MSRHYDLTKPPKFVVNILDRFRKWKLSRYKKKKVRQEKTNWDRDYFLRFYIKIDDPINPQEIKKKYTMVIPAKAAFFAKRKAMESIKKKLTLEFVECDTMTEEDFEYMESTKEDYINKKEDLI